MDDISEFLCVICDKPAKYRITGQHRPLYCTDHKPRDAKLLQTKKCYNAKCKTRTRINTPYCVRHRNPEITVSEITVSKNIKNNLLEINVFASCPIYDRLLVEELNKHISF